MFIGFHPYQAWFYLVSCPSADHVPIISLALGTARVGARETATQGLNEPMRAVSCCACAQVSFTND